MGGEDLEPSPQLLGIITSVFLLRLTSKECPFQKTLEILKTFTNSFFQPLAVPLHRSAGKLGGNWTILAKIWPGKFSSVRTIFILYKCSVCSFHLHHFTPEILSDEACHNKIHPVLLCQQSAKAASHGWIFQVTFC